MALHAMAATRSQSVGVSVHPWVPGLEAPLKPYLERASVKRILDRYPPEDHSIAHLIAQEVEQFESRFQAFAAEWQGTVRSLYERERVVQPSSYGAWQLGLERERTLADVADRQAFMHRDALESIVNAIQPDSKNYGIRFVYAIERERWQHGMLGLASSAPDLMRIVYETRDQENRPLDVVCPDLHEIMTGYCREVVHRIREVEAWQIQLARYHYRFNDKRVRNVEGVTTFIDADDSWKRRSNELVRKGVSSLEGLRTVNWTTLDRLRAALPPAVSQLIETCFLKAAIEDEGNPGFGVGEALVDRLLRDIDDRSDELNTAIAALREQYHRDLLSAAKRLVDAREARCIERIGGKPKGPVVDVEIAVALAEDALQSVEQALVDGVWARLSAERLVDGERPALPFRTDAIAP
ncbi:MAG: hypothetical protein KF724_12945 [Phycisphaeraceae bacterium]|nr:hypothetical protein [Phycisphaeraceae bacterium]